MRYGFILPGGTATEQLEQAITAENAGWDGVFTWEAAYGTDPWTLMAAMAARTSRVRLGTMLTPLPWRRPWKLASQVMTLDQLSGGRAILAVGLGAVDPGLGSQSGEVQDRKVRAAMLDEGIDLMRGLWDGEPTFSGEHYSVDFTPRTDLAVTSRPVQKRIPIWLVGPWQREKSMRRVLRCDGLLPNIVGDKGPRQPTPDEYVAMREWLAEHGARPDIDIIMEGETPADDAEAAADIVGPFRDAGATWWLESRWGGFYDPDKHRAVVQERIAAGPPRV